MNTTIADELIATVENASEELRRLSERDVSFKPAPGKWSKKEVLGHLIDSAANNHHRFVRARKVKQLVFPDYEQDDWVSLQRYESSTWTELIELWRLYNRHLGHVITRIPEEDLQIDCRIGPDDAVTLGYLVEDYLSHLQHHLRQLVAL